MSKLPYFRLSAVCLVALAACAGGQTGSEGVKGTKGVHNIGDPCSDNRECEQQLERALQSIATPPKPIGTKLFHASCEVVADTCASAGTRYCHCSYLLAPFEVVKPLSFALGADADCALYGRSLACLEGTSDFSGCEPTACSCVAACQDALDRMQADDRRRVAVEARRAVCETGTCRFALRIEDRCYAGAWPEPGSPSYACSLSDQALLDAAASAASCAEVDCGAPLTSPRAVCVPETRAADLSVENIAACVQRGSASGSPP